MALNTPIGGSKRCFTLSTEESEQNDLNFKNYYFEKKTYNNFRNSQKTECLLCKSKEHVKLLNCDAFKSHDMATRVRIVLDNGLYWCCLGPRHWAFQCMTRDIDPCRRWLHNKLVRNCNYSGKKMISGSLAVEKACSHSRVLGKWVRLPILPVRVYSPKGSKLVYALIDSGSEETLISKSLYDELKLCGIPLDVLLITANGSRNLISTFDTSFKVGPADSGVKFDVNQALVMDCLPDIDNNFPTSQNLHPFKNISDLIRNNKFPRLIDSHLNIIIGVR